MTWQHSANRPSSYEERSNSPLGGTTLETRQTPTARRTPQSEKRYAMPSATRRPRAGLSCAKLWTTTRGDFCTKRIGRKRPGIEALGREDPIANHLFPDSPATDWSQEPQLLDEPGHQPVDQFILEELCEACLRLPAGKATGPDGIPNDVLLRVSRTVPHVLLKTFNFCLSQIEFPARWKTARLVLLHKRPGKPIQESSSYRPLCMLNSTAKLLE